MGTSYQVRVDPRVSTLAGTKRTKTADLRVAVQSLLDRRENAMSNWKKDSDISRFNASPPGRPIQLRPSTARVVRESLVIARRTGGAFDPTVSELVELWGFGARRRKPGEPVPGEDRLRDVLKRTGYKYLRLTGSKLRKTRSGTTLNLSAIAKGFAVDSVFELVRASGYPAAMVEIGGEVRVGVSPAGREHWRIGIEKPDYSRGGRRIHVVAHLKNNAMATSGDYRNYYKVGAKQYSHILDPRTGRPARSRVVSATIIGPSCMRTDALATAMLVMGAEKGMRLIKSQKGYEALLLVRGSSPSTLREFATSGMHRHLQRKPK